MLGQLNIFEMMETRHGTRSLLNSGISINNINNLLLTNNNINLSDEQGLIFTGSTNIN